MLKVLSIRSLSLMFFLTMMIAQVFVNQGEAFEVKNDPNRDLVIISCSGKSGSSTLEASFVALGFETIRHHGLPQELIDYALLRSQTAKVIFVDSFRDPVSRKISTYFHHLASNLKLRKNRIRSKYRHDSNALINEILNDFDKKLTKPDLGYTFSHWRKLNYNCLADGVFDQKKKYQLHNDGNLYFVNLRFNDIKDWQGIIRSLDVPFNLKKFKVVPANMSNARWYRNIYNNFLDKFTIKQEDFDLVLNRHAKVITHFDQEDGIKKIIKKWKPKIRL